MMNLCGRVGSCVTSNTLGGGPDHDSHSRIFQRHLCHCRIAAIAWILLVKHEVVDEFMKYLREWISKKLLDFSAYSDHDSSGILHGNFTTANASTPVVRRSSSALAEDCCLRVLLVLINCRSTDDSGWLKRSMRKRSEPEESIKNDTVVSQRI